MMKRLTLLGSTGSIGTSTLAVIAANPELYQVTALVAGQNVALMAEQCLQFQPRYAAMSDEKSAQALRERLKALNVNTEVLSGVQAACELAALDDVDQVMAAIVGASGLQPTMAAIRAGKTVLLANKESLVTCGRLFMEAVRQHQVQLLPVDSEHNAIFQSLPASIQHQLGYADLRGNGIESILLTGSGGPFRDTPLADLAGMSPDQACAHPNWSMGRKISVDSATMLNKGLEVIEAHWLFAMPADRIDVLIHPQSTVHSLVEYEDGSVLAQLGQPDMRTPIAYGLGFPERIESGVGVLDLARSGRLDFEQPDLDRFPCLASAYAALRAGQGACIVLNAANEVAVDAFLNGRLGFMAIARVIDAALEWHAGQRSVTLSSLEDILALDVQAREFAARHRLAKAA